MRAIAEALDSKVLAGRLDWGPAGAPDASLLRAYANAISTPGDFVVGRDSFLGTDAGRLYFGVNADVFLFRPAAATLETPQTFRAAELTSPGRLGPQAVSVSDFNAATSNGWYWGTGAANQPPIGAGSNYFAVRTDALNAYTQVRQTAWQYLLDVEWVRYARDGVWTAWVQTWPPPAAAGSELIYTQATANVSTSATTEATSVSFISSSPFSADGATRVSVEFWCPGILQTGG